MAVTARITELSKLWVLIVQLLISNPTTASACLGEEVKLSCATSHYTTTWHIELRDWTALRVTRLFERTDNVGRMYLIPELQLCFKLLSNTMGVLNSTWEIRTTQALAEASIECEGTTTRRYVLNIAGMPVRPTNITRLHTTYSIIASNVTLSWNLPTVGRVDMYHVDVYYESNLLMNYSINTPAITLEGIPYDQQVIVSIASVNCYSDSERAYFNITIRRCNKTAPKDGLLINNSLAVVNSIPGEEIMFTCNPGYAPQVLKTATCKEDGTWDPHPMSTVCLIECRLPVLSHLEIDNESINSTVVGEEIHFKCQTGFIAKSLRPSVCSSEGAWVPDPQEYECQIEDTQQNSHDNQSLLTKMIAGSITGIFLVGSVFLCVTICTVKCRFHQRRSRILAGVDLHVQVAEPTYDTVDSAYAVICQERKETELTVNNAYNFEL